MGSGYDVANTSRLQGLYPYLTEMMASLEPDQPIPTRIALGNLGGAASWSWDVADRGFWSHGSTISSSFSTAKSWVQPTDPLTLDLDGDGIETVGTGAGVLFDHNGDGIKTGTGWIHPEDGLLVRDINSNGLIDSGAELFR